MRKQRLTPKQKAFCDYYIETGNGAEAARKAGYKGKAHDRIASENLRKLEIKKYIAEKMAEKDKERIASQDEILERLTRVLRREEMEYNVVTLRVRKTFTDENGKRKTVEEEKAEVVPVPAKISDVNKAAELLGKRYVLWTDRQQVENITPVFVDDVPDEDD